LPVSLLNLNQKSGVGAIAYGRVVVVDEVELEVVEAVEVVVEVEEEVEVVVEVVDEVVDVVVELVAVSCQLVAFQIQAVRLAPWSFRILTVNE